MNALPKETQAANRPPRTAPQYSARRRWWHGPSRSCRTWGFLALEEAFFRPAKQAARDMAALYIGGMGVRGTNFYNTAMVRYGYPHEAATIQNLYLDKRKAEAAAALPEEFITNTNLIGPPELVRERIAALREAAVTHLHVTPIGSDPAKLLSQLREWIS